MFINPLITTLRRADLLPELPLFFRQRAGKLHVGGGVQVPLLVALANNRHAVSLQPERLARLSRLGYFEADRARNRRHLRLSAKHGRGGWQRHLRVEIVSLAL